ncbi:MAG: hypothetical protein H6672_17445 [Anaerolineaceae bacterium]|nr:hypothetical protein [Anaerolineaceae bacterium]
MPDHTPFITRQRIHLLLALFVLLASVYMFTYDGDIESGDTLGLFDAVASQVRFGDDLLALSAWFWQPATQPAHELYPIQHSNAEPLQTWLGAGLYWLADKLPGVGLVHMVWLANILVSAAAGCVVFLYALAAGHSERTAILGALGFGLGTIIWPYSKTFFREPLALLLILLTAFFAERWRQSGYRAWGVLIGGCVAAVGAFLTKEAIIFAAPALVLLLLPDVPRLRPWVRRLTILWIILIGIVLVLVAIQPYITVYQLSAGISPVLSPLIGQRSPYLSSTFLEAARQAVHTYLLSIGGSVWGTSPLALLALPGLALLFRRRQYRMVWVVPALVLGFAFGYALLRGQHWFGGFSWPPRFLIPVVPFLILAGLPVIELAFSRPQRRMLWIGIGVLACYSLWVQLSGVLLPWNTYNQVLPPEAHGLSEWSGGLNVARYLRWVLLPPLWAERPLYFAWIRANTPLWAVMFAGLGLVAGWVIGRGLRQPRETARRWGRAAYALPLALVVLTWLGLRMIDADPFYTPPSSETLFALLPVVAAESNPGDVLLLNNNNYVPFFMNNGKINQPRVISLPDQPGEQPSPEQPPQVVSSNPADLLVTSTTTLIYNLAQTHDTLWLLVDASVWLPYRVRPVERFMTAHYYPIRDVPLDPPDATVRLLEFSMVSAPDTAGFRGPDVLTDLQYGDALRLLGVTLPAGTRYTPDAVLPVSLYWQGDDPLKRDYTVAWFVADSAGNPVVQGQDTQPAGGFPPTSQWLPDVPVWDNRALRLPQGLSPGTYNLWVRVYAGLPDGTLDILPVTGAQTRDGTIGVLPVTIEVQNAE